MDDLQVVLAQPTHLPRIGELRQALHYRGIRRNRQGHYPAPSQSTFSRFLAGIDAAALEASLREVQTRVRGPAPENEIVVLDGKEPNHGSDASVLSAVSVLGRVAIRLLMEWRSHQPNARHLTTTDFQTIMAENHRAKALRFVLSKRPNFKENIHEWALFFPSAHVDWDANQ